MAKTTTTKKIIANNLLISSVEKTITNSVGNAIFSH